MAALDVTGGGAQPWLMVGPLGALSQSPLLPSPISLDSLEVEPRRQGFRAPQVILKHNYV